MRAFVTLVLALLVTNAFAGEEMRVKLLENIFSGINTSQKITLWSDNKEILSLLKENNNYKTSESCEGSSLLVLQSSENITKECLDKNIFVLDYKLLNEIPNSFGALFWKKGRPNIILIEPRLKASSIKISNKLESYVEDVVW